MKKVAACFFAVSLILWANPVFVNNVRQPEFLVFPNEADFVRADVMKLYFGTIYVVVLKSGLISGQIFFYLDSKVRQFDQKLELHRNRPLVVVDYAWGSADIWVDKDQDGNFDELL